MMDGVVQVIELQTVFRYCLLSTLLLKFYSVWGLVLVSSKNYLWFWAKVSREEYYEWVSCFCSCRSMREHARHLMPQSVIQAQGKETRICRGTAFLKDVPWCSGAVSRDEETGDTELWEGGYNWLQLNQWEKKSYLTLSRLFFSMKH